MRGRVPSDPEGMLVVGAPESDRVLGTALAMRPAMECGNTGFEVLSPHVPPRPFGRGMPQKTPTCRLEDSNPCMSRGPPN